MSIPSVFWVGQERNGPLGQYAKWLGKTGGTLCCHSSPWEKSRTELSSHRVVLPWGVTSVKWKLLFPFSMHHSQLFWSTKGTGTSQVYSWPPIKVFSSGTIVKNQCFSGRYICWDILFLPLADILPNLSLPRILSWFFFYIYWGSLTGFLF